MAKKSFKSYILQSLNSTFSDFRGHKGTNQLSQSLEDDQRQGNIRRNYEESQGVIQKKKRKFLRL